MDGISFVQTNLFFKISRIDEVFFKVPSQRGFGDYRQFIKLARSSGDDIRILEDAERFENLPSTLGRTPALKQIAAIHPDFAHYLGVHTLQYQRLRGQTAVEIPAARFGLLQSSLLELEPVLFQERVRGATLWSMFDFSTEKILPRWEPFLPAISGQLAELLDAELTEHIDWNIKNFVFDPSEERLFYVDLKPTILVARRTNEQNLEGIRRHFLI